MAQIFLIGLAGLLSALLGVALSLSALVSHRANPTEAANLFRRANIVLFISSSFAVFHTVDAFTNRNEKTLYQVVVQYSVVAFPLALALFVVAFTLQRQGRAVTAFWWYAGSAVSWATVGWGHIVMFCSLIYLSLFLR